MPPRWGWERRASPLIQRQGTLALSLREREQRIPRSDESRRSGLAKALRAVLPLLGERAGVRGKKRCAHQRACELPMKSATRSEGTQSSTAGKATCPWQLQADFPLTLALSLREREQHIPRCDESRRSGLARAQRAVLPLPLGGGEWESFAALELPLSPALSPLVPRGERERIRSRRTA